MKIFYRTLLDKPFSGKCIFHPKIAVYPDGRLLMTFQEILGSDYYGPVMALESEDGGFRWNHVHAIPGLGIRMADDDVTERNCDVVPDFDPASRRMVAIGHNAYGKKEGFLDTQGFFRTAERRSDLRRRGVYCVRHEDGTWGARRLLNPELFADWNFLCCGCTQKIIRNNGEWLIPFSGLDDPRRHMDHIATVCKFRFDGEEFHFIENGDWLTLPVGRGLLEPSLIEFGGKILITLRAEDGRAHYAVSEDGLHYGNLETWEFDDGEPVATSTTQQHWLVARGRLHLIYTRNFGWNEKVFRYRAPLSIAEVDFPTMKLVRSSERTVFPFDGDPRRPESAALSGNFHICMLPDGSAIVTDASLKPYYENYEGLAMLGLVTTDA